MTTDDNDYDAFAAAYAADNQSNAWNAHYERPAMLRLARQGVPLNIIQRQLGHANLGTTSI
jgi:integrase